MNVNLSTLQHRIPLEKAIQMTTLFRKSREEILQPTFQGKEILPFSETFNKEAMLRLLAQPNCAGMRIYYGMDASLKVHAILVGVDSENRDILPNPVTVASATAGEEEGGEILDEGLRCPPACPKDPSPLNP